MAQTTDGKMIRNQKGASMRRMLYTQIEKLERDIRVGRELIVVEQKRLAQKSRTKVQKLENRLNKNLKREKLSVGSSYLVREEWLKTELPPLAAKQRLQYRKLRQDLRRSENLLDKQGNLREANKILSPGSQKKLEQLLNEHNRQREALSLSLLKKAQDSRLSKAALSSRRTALEKASSDASAKITALREKLAKKDAARLASLSKKQEARALKLQTSLHQKQARLHNSALEAQYALPRDVCLRLDGVTMMFGGLKAVDDLSFDVKKGEIFGLIGPNGAGKTTVFNCITQFYKPTHGNIIYRTHEGNVLLLNYYQVHDIITKGIVRTFQNVEVIGELSILENLLIAAHQEYNAGLFSQMINSKKSNAKKKSCVSAP